jgi:hypothetical protein
LGSTGCTIIKTTDVTDASFKRFQSVAFMGWPVYTRVTDREPGRTARLATHEPGLARSTTLRPAEFSQLSDDPAALGLEDESVVLEADDSTSPRLRQSDDVSGP